MTKKRAEFLYKFTGTILGRSWQKASPQSKYAGTEYLILKVVLENQPYPSLQVFKEKTNPKIWKTIQQAKPKQILRKKYIFHCRNQRGYYYLVDMEEAA